MTTRAELDELVRVAARSRHGLESVSPSERASLLRSMADALGDHRKPIVETADRESALGDSRLDGELTRCQAQLQLFADVLEEGSFVDAVIDHADGGLPEVRRMLVPIGVVAVFGASNFPLAFSVPGGDTASALAAGCPIVIKAHPSHPETCLLACRALDEGARAAGAGDGTVSLVYGEAAGRDLVAHPDVAAVGFTGSMPAARALQDVIASRPRPIPFYGELGGINPLVVSPAVEPERVAGIAHEFVASFTLGVGQFCTKPGLAMIPRVYLEPFVDAVRDDLAGLDGGHLLNVGIRDRFSARVHELQAQFGDLEVVASSRRDRSGTAVAVYAVVTNLARVAGDSELLEECFGPITVIAAYDNIDEVVSILGSMEPSLTATIHGPPGPADTDSHRILDAARATAGRIVWNGFPTGVRVGWAMHHGGPYPATTNPMFTSVGAASIRRWLRPVAFQGLPDDLLPIALQEENRWSLPRRVDGRVIP